MYRAFVKMLGEKVRLAIYAQLLPDVAFSARLFTEFSLCSLLRQTNAEEYAPARIKGAHRALEKMGLRSDGKQWLADNVCGPIQPSDPRLLRGCCPAVACSCPFAHAPTAVSTSIQMGSAARSCTRRCATC